MEGYQGKGHEGTEVNWKHRPVLRSIMLLYGLWFRVKLLKFNVKHFIFEIDEHRIFNKKVITH